MNSLLAIGSALFAAIAGYFLYLAFSAEIVVVTEAGEVANLQLMHLQSAHLAIAIGAVVVSAILAVGSAIVAAIERASDPLE